MIESRPTTKTSSGQPVRKPPMPSSTGTGPPAGLRTKPASTRPMIVMNRPMPTLIAVLSWAGMALKTACRKPVSTSTVMMMPSRTTRPIASAHVISGVRHSEGHEGVEPQAGRQRQGVVGHDTHEQRHHAGDQCGGRGDHVEVGRGAAAEELAGGVGLGPDDQRVQHDDVGHREERRQPAADLAAHGGTALGDLEEGVESAGRGGRSRGGGGLRHGQKTRAWPPPPIRRAD